MSEPQSQAKGIEFFKADVQAAPVPDAADPYAPVEMGYASDDDRRIFEAAAPAIFGNQKGAFVVFPDVPVNMTVIEFGPNYVLPQHSHAEHCLYYIEFGEIVMGSRHLGPGEGFLVRAHQPYAYTSGPAGVRVLEIRPQPVPSPNFTLREKNLPAWSHRFHAALGVEAPSAVS